MFNSIYTFYSGGAEYLSRCAPLQPHDPCLFN